MSYNRQLHQAHLAGQDAGVSLFDESVLPKEPVDKIVLAQDILMSPFHLALMLASPNTTPNPGTVAYFGMRPDATFSGSRKSPVAGVIEDWLTIRCNDQVFTSLAGATLEAKSSQERGNFTSSDGWKSTYIPKFDDPNSYTTILDQFHWAFVNDNLLEGSNYYLLMEREYLAYFLVTEKIVKQEDAYQVLSRLGYVKKRLRKNPPSKGGITADQEAYWASLGRSYRSWKGGVTKKLKKEAVERKEYEESLAKLELARKKKREEKRAQEEAITQYVQDGFVFVDLDDHDAGQDLVPPAGEMPLKTYEATTIPEDNLEEGKTFSFTGDVVEEFEEKVIRTQIPGYSSMRSRVLATAFEFVHPDMKALDIGCSRGKTFRDIFDLLAAKSPAKLREVVTTSNFLGIDIEAEMIESAKEATYRSLSEYGIREEESLRAVQYKEADLLSGILEEVGNIDLITSILTIQFTPIEYRQEILSHIYNALVPGGAFIWVEKIRMDSAYTDKISQKLYYDEKARNGISRDAIEKKRRSIERFLVPETDAGNFALLEQAGFTKFRTMRFWQDLQFVAYLAIK